MDDTTSPASGEPHVPLNSQQYPAFPDQQPRDVYNTTRPRAASRPTPLASQQQPIKDAVNTAFDQAPTADQLDPDFLKRLTEHVTDQVIRNLQAANLSGPTPPSSFNSQQSQQASFERSPLQSSTDSFSPNFTPPSPQQDRYRYASPERPPSDDGSNYSRESKESMRSRASTQSNRETTPRASEPVIVQGIRRSQTTAGTIPTGRNSFSLRGEGLPDFKTARKDSKDAEPIPLDETLRARTRPSPSQEDSSEATTLEKIWQPLFDNGRPTMRLGQFLRGLAKHIIDDYEPKGSLVITPAKMKRFFDETKVDDEHYPWTTIFGGKLCSSSISVMYRKLLCHHHFVQQQVHEAPTIPALSPLGFEAFMTCLIQAHPDTEFERLAKAVMEMPISNADDPRERFPKELSRRLLPALPNVPAEQRIISSLAHEPVLVPLERGNSAMPPPPPSAPPQQSSFTERERNPYSHTSQSSNAVDDDDLTPPSVPIERERKPYYAKEGMGKRYDSEAEWAREQHGSQTPRDSSHPAASKYRPERPEYQTSRPSRQNSGVPPQTMYSQAGATDPMNISPPNRKRMSSGPLPPPNNNPNSSAGYAKPSRRSPPPSRSFARSEPADVGSIPPAQFASNLHSREFRERAPAEIDEEMRFNGRRPNERSVNFMTDDDQKGRPIPPRKPTIPSGYDSGYGFPPPNNNNFTPKSAGPGGSDDRRRSWYPGMGHGGVPGGTDGYGSNTGAGTGTGYGTSAQY